MLRNKLIEYGGISLISSALAVGSICYSQSSYNRAQEFNTFEVREALNLERGLEKAISNKDTSALVNLSQKYSDVMSQNNVRSSLHNYNKYNKLGNIFTILFGCVVGCFSCPYGELFHKEVMKKRSYKKLAETATL